MIQHSGPLSQQVIATGPSGAILYSLDQSWKPHTKTSMEPEKETPQDGSSL